MCDSQWFKFNAFAPENGLNISISPIFEVFALAITRTDRRVVTHLL